jgi:hypothetical protein
MSVSRKETLLVIKQRLLGLALSLALLGTLGFAATAHADTAGSGDIDVTGSTADVLTMTVGPSSINFGNGLDFLGNGAGPDVQQVCDLANGARFVGPNVNVTVSSSQPYTVDRSVQDLGSTPASQMADRAFLHAGTYNFSCSFPGAAYVSTLGGNTEFATNAAAGKNISASEFYVIEVLANDDPGSYHIKVTYSATQN